MDEEDSIHGLTGNAAKEEDVRQPSTDRSVDFRAYLLVLTGHPGERHPLSTFEHAPQSRSISCRSPLKKTF